MLKGGKMRARGAMLTARNVMANPIRKPYHLMADTIAMGDSGIGSGEDGEPLSFVENTRVISGGVDVRVISGGTDVRVTKEPA